MLMSKKVIILSIVSFVLLVTNIATVLIYNYQIFDLRNQSSFVEIANGSKSFKECLDRSGVENKMTDGKILIREIDGNLAISACS